MFPSWKALCVFLSLPCVSSLIICRDWYLQNGKHCYSLEIEQDLLTCPGTCARTHYHRWILLPTVHWGPSLTVTTAHYKLLSPRLERGGERPREIERERQREREIQKYQLSGIYRVKQFHSYKPQCVNKANYTQTTFFLFYLYLARQDS